jgi:hypothetical protein
MAKQQFLITVRGHINIFWLGFYDTTINCSEAGSYFATHSHLREIDVFASVQGKREGRRLLLFLHLKDLHCIDLIGA